MNLTLGFNSKCQIFSPNWHLALMPSVKLGYHLREESMHFGIWYMRNTFVSDYVIAQLNYSTDNQGVACGIASSSHRISWNSGLFLDQRVQIPEHICSFGKLALIHILHHRATIRADASRLKVGTIKKHWSIDVWVPKNPFQRRFGFFLWMIKWEFKVSPHPACLCNHKSWI